MKYICLIIILIFSLFSCSISDKSQLDYCDMVYKIMDQFAKDMGIKHYLSLRSYGGGFFERINSIILSFETIGPKSQEELRELMVEITEDFLERINKDEKIREYLANYPFTASNIHFRISLVDAKRKEIKNNGSGTEMLYSVLMLEGRMIYSILNDDKTCLQAIYRESYDEALEIVKKQRPDLFQN